MTALNGSIDADKTNMPLLRSERNWGSWQLFFSLATVAAATWCYIIGEYVGYYLGLKQSFTTLVGGSMIGISLVILALGGICLRYGIDSIAASKVQFGTRGWVIPFTLQFASIFGWNCLLLIFFGKSLVQFCVSAGWLAPGDHAWLQSAATLAACSLAFLVLLAGVAGVDRIAKILVVHVLVGFWMIWLIVDQRWEALMTAVPSYASTDPMWNYTTGIELAIAPALSWWPYFGAMVRNAPSGRVATVPAMMGFGLIVGLLSMVGVAGILAVQISDPAEWMREIGGQKYATISLAFVTAANLGTSIAGIYCAAIGLRHHKKLETVRWEVVLALAILPVAVASVVAPDLVFNNFSTFLAFIAVAFAPICGIQIVDFYLLRGQKISIKAIYDRSPGKEYYYWGGVNPAAVLAIIGGVICFLSLLNPLSYESAALYAYTTASLPAAAFAGLVYALATLFIVRPARKGGY